MLQVSRVQHDIGVGLAQKFRGVLQWRGRVVVVRALSLRLAAAILSVEQKFAVSALVRIHSMQKRHDVLHNVLMIDDSFL